ncbi:MAG: serine/threonine protein phosphatase [Runella slithyformis]|nr:MAG: serine/threonine protein phosphatase [Runella slithyformis]TAF26655.1 MAG: serine/threonine protein phosphatase [Runella slithyformis]TAF47285.1 MAG: serine/threonine protein phosphatase [Runella slithyformis]TAF82150.1 MAG: serine/threonine protein phosphatase [Runella slithyformis]TAH08683.1 MAG: serine/threonine protein phosphatase [Runella slithyformis]
MAIVRENFLSKYLKDRADGTVLSKGKAVYIQGGGYSVVRLDLSGRGFAEFKMKGDSYGSTYRTLVEDFNTSGVKSSCTCSEGRGGVCKHRVAAILHILDRMPNAVEPTYFSMSSSTVPLPLLQDDLLRPLVTPETWQNRHSMKTVRVESAKDGMAECKVVFKKEEYNVSFKFFANTKQLYTSCSCNARLTSPLCAHKLAALLAIKTQMSERAFELMRDFSDEKNALLAEYGFSLQDEIKNKFDFKIDNKGILQLLKLDSSIQKIGTYQNWGNVRDKLLMPAAAVGFQASTNAEPVLEDDERVVLYVWSQGGASNLLDTNFGVFSAKISAKTGKLTFIKSITGDYVQPSEMPELAAEDWRLIKLAKRLSSDGLQAFVKKQNWQTGWYWSMSDLTAPQKREVQTWVGRQIERIFQDLKEERLFVSDSDYVSTQNDLRAIALHRAPVKPFFILKEEKDFVSLEPYVEIEPNKPVELEHVSAFKSFWTGTYRGQKFFKWANINDAEMVAYFRENGFKMRVRKAFADGFLTDWVIPMTEQFDVLFQTRHAVQNQTLPFQKARIYLKEDDASLLIVPTYVYEGETADDEVEFMNDQRRTKARYENGEIVLMERNRAAEAEAWDWAKTLHPDFERQSDQPFFSVLFTEVMKDGWLFKMVEAVQEKGVQLLGFKELKKMRFNPNKGKFNIKASSGIDWFDMKVEISFGDQHISLADAKKALLKKQNYVELKDGTLGMIPEEWIKKLDNVLKFGTVKGDDIKLSKLHFSLIDDLIDNIDDLQIQRELFEKKQKLLNFKEMAAVPKPKNVRAELRHYQEEGFKWLNFLDEFKWGGCLADDMGLGKTVQMLTFLQHQKNQIPDAVNLVIVPTTLIFNWQAESEKFTPELKLHVHRGNMRQRDINFFKDFDIVLTTYGTMRSDIDVLRHFHFHYIVLDESQAIKNPDSLTAKASRLLNAHNRLTMTGTPVENNTFDLYSQMEFLNPGLLGSVEFFKSEYATPIDKLQDKTKAQELRRIIYPFMLKRTKEEVAPDLPDKTETILYCEMGPKQRKVYETFREKYRQQIADKLATEGLNKSSFLVLEALMKLRQICDSPALLSDDADYGNESAKLEEIVREIEENASNHKILIFSQFLKMLDLVRTYLEKANIPYEYLDGQTDDRASRVNRFQNDQNCRVFLMSLKAGGVGLNLTEADYVYLVDPWWNPAVERQAIDRTHRIGQTKKVFAYKMICKDSIEEKILLLQARKKELAEDLISTEQGFIKKLTQDDIMALFS